MVKVNLTVYVCALYKSAGIHTHTGATNLGGSFTHVRSFTSLRVSVLVVIMGWNQ